MKLKKVIAALSAVAMLGSFAVAIPMGASAAVEDATYMPTGVEGTGLLKTETDIYVDSTKVEKASYIDGTKGGAVVTYNGGQAIDVSAYNTVTVYTSGDARANATVKIGETEIATVAVGGTTKVEGAQNNNFCFEPSEATFDPTNITAGALTIVTGGGANAWSGNFYKIVFSYVEPANPTISSEIVEGSKVTENGTGEHKSQVSTGFIAKLTAADGGSISKFGVKVNDTDKNLKEGTLPSIASKIGETTTVYLMVIINDAASNDAITTYVE